MANTALIIGAGPGVGLAVARRFGREGFTLGLIARRQEQLDVYIRELADAGMTALGFPADAGDTTALAGAIAGAKAALGAPSVLVYNAAAARMSKASEIAPETVMNDFAVSVVGAIIAAQAVIPEMRAAGAGTILLTGGGFSLYPNANFASLSIGKAGIRSLAFAMGDELEPQGIHVATVTILGTVAPDTAFDPDTIAEHYWALHTQVTGAWEREIQFRGTAG